MIDRESILPVCVGLVLAVVLYFALGSQGSTLMSTGNFEFNPTNQPETDEPPTQEPETETETPNPKTPPPPQRTWNGQLKPSQATTINLLSYEDYQEMMAEESQLNQPHAQMTAQATANAPIPKELPTEPAPQPSPSAQPIPVAAQQPAPADQGTPTVKQPDPETGEQDEKIDPTQIALAQAEQPQPVNAMPVSVDPVNDPTLSLPESMNLPQRQWVPVPIAAPNPDTQQRDEAKPRPATVASNTPVIATPTQPQTGAQPTAPSNPTRSPKADFESPLVKKIHSAQVVPGAVMSMQGIQVKTVAPRYSAVTRVSAQPRNSVYTIAFNQEGKVISVTLLRGSGHPGVDAAVITAIYKWTAEGDIPPNGLVFENFDFILNRNELDDSNNESTEGETEPPADDPEADTEAE